MLYHAGASDRDSERTQTIAEATGLTVANGNEQKKADAEEDTLRPCSPRDSKSICAFFSTNGILRWNLSLFSKNRFLAQVAKAHPLGRTKRDPDRGDVLPEATWGARGEDALFPGEANVVQRNWKKRNRFSKERTDLISFDIHSHR